ncbi:MAG: ABC transporter ATP-binding protein [Acetobacteraceae bacterium]|nr:ABC transporter ATP-binding protein [Acetobacteraceae bacterium]
MTLLAVQGLRVAFGAKEVVRDVSFSIERGETLALVGESGSGKSLTALSLLQLLPPGAVASGHVQLAGYEMIGAPAAKLRRIRGGIAGMVFQEPLTSLNPLTKLGQQVAEAVMLHKPGDPAKVRARVINVLSQAGFADAEHRLDAYPHQLSGGQRQRVMIAMALANDPALLIADEPTTALDVTIQAHILRLLAEQKAARGLALLLISHDLAIVRRYADRVCVMKEGRIVETGRVADVFAAPRHGYTKLLIAAEPKGSPMPCPNDAPVIMEAAELCVHFVIRRGVLRRRVGAIRAVDGLSLTVRRGETLGLVGESGSGKSTTGFALLGLERSRGRIAFEGRELHTIGRREMRQLRARMQIVFQDPFGSLSPRLNIGEIIAEGLLVHEPRLTRMERDARVAEALDEVGIARNAADRYPHEFSGGQRQRVAIARALVLKPHFVVLDEPTSALDMSVQAQIVELLRRVQKEHALGYLFISHDLRVVRALAHRVIVLRHGRVVEEGTSEQIFSRPKADYTRALMRAAFALEADDTVDEEEKEGAALA